MNHTIVRSSVFVLAALVVCTFLYSILVMQVSAQSAIGGTSSLKLVLNPSLPNPSETVIVSLDDYALDTTGSRINWFVDGIEQKDQVNSRSISVPLGSLGEKTTVRVTLTRNGALGLSVTRTIIPSAVDVIIEANTSVPSFYRGRALPSEMSVIRAIAIPHTGTKTSRTAYTYKWSLGSTVLFGGPQLGKYAIETTLPRYNSYPLTVEVFDANGASVARGTAMVGTKRPELYFYEESPLRGLRERALVSPAPLVSQETTIHGALYYVDLGTTLGKESYAWSISGASVPLNAHEGSMLTVEKKGSGIARLGLTIGSIDAGTQYAQDEIELSFE